MILNKIKGFFLKNKKTILFLSFFVILIFSIGDTFAETPKTTSKDGMSSLIEGLNLFLSIFSTLLGLLSSLVALLLNPGWVNGTIFGLDIYLKDIWILISNIVYFIFAFILIVIAFMNIVGQGGGTWELKSALPKFVVGVIMVPFTWFFVQFILSISAFLTVAVLSLPYEVMADTKVFEEASNFKICRTFEFNLKTQKGKKVDNTKKLEDCIKKGKPVVNGIGDYYTVQQLLKGEEGVKGASSSIFSIINIYTYGIMKIQDVQKATKDQLKEIKDFSSLTLKIIFDMLFMIVFLIIMIALFMAMFARGIQLWLHAMFSPIYGLLFFFGKSKEGFGETKLSPLEFIKLAMVPVFVAAALAFGMIFMFTAAHGLSEAQSGGGKIFTNSEDGKTSNLNIGGFVIKVGGIQGGATTTNSLFNSLGNGIGQILLEIFGLVILWMAVMAALKSSEITHNVVKPIISFGESIGSLVAKAPQYAPIIPTPGENTTAAGLGRLGQSINTHFSNEALKSGDKAYESLFGGGQIPAELKAEMRTLGDKMLHSNGNKDDIKKYRDNVFLKLKDIDVARTDKDSEKYLKGLADIANVKTDGVFNNKNTFSKFLFDLNNKLIADGKGTGILDNKRITSSNADDIKKYFGGGTPPTTPTSPTTPAGTTAKVDFKIGSVNYNMKKSGNILEFDNPTAGGKDLVFDKSKIIKADGTFDDSAIKKIISDNHVTDTGDKLLKKVKEELK